jgi:hypothetical protein
MTVKSCANSSTSWPFSSHLGRRSKQACRAKMYPRSPCGQGVLWNRGRWSDLCRQYARRVPPVAVGAFVRQRAVPCPTGQMSWSGPCPSPYPPRYLRPSRCWCFVLRLSSLRRRRIGCICPNHPMPIDVRLSITASTEGEGICFRCKIRAWTDRIRPRLG